MDGIVRQTSIEIVDEYDEGSIETSQHLPKFLPKSGDLFRRLTFDSVFEEAARLLLHIGGGLLYRLNILLIGFASEHIAEGFQSLGRQPKGRDSHRECAALDKQPQGAKFVD